MIEQSPLFGAILVIYYIQRQANIQNQQWLEHMLEGQREIYEAQNQFLKDFITQLIAQLKDISNQLAINTNTVSEIAKVDSIISELITRLEKK